MILCRARTSSPRPSVLQAKPGVRGLTSTLFGMLFRGKFQFEAKLVRATKSPITTQDTFVLEQSREAIAEVFNALPTPHRRQEIFIVRYGLARESSIVDDLDESM